MVSCSVYGCGRSTTRHKGHSFYSVPAMITRQCNKTRELSEKRRKAWIASMKRTHDIDPNSTKQYKVCADHFISGRPAALFDVNSPDWTPSLRMGSGVRRYKSKRSQLQLQEAVAEASGAPSPPSSQPHLVNQQDDSSMSMRIKEEPSEDLDMSCKDVTCQTDMTMCDLANMQTKFKNMVEQLKHLNLRLQKSEEKNKVDELFHSVHDSVQSAQIMVRPVHELLEVQQREPVLRFSDSLQPMLSESGCSMPSGHGLSGLSVFEYSMPSGSGLSETSVSGWFTNEGPVELTDPADIASEDAVQCVKIIKF